MELEQHSYGRHIRRLEFDGLVVTESLRLSNERLPKHSHDFTNIAVVLEGSFLELVGPAQERCEPNSLVIRPGGEFHTDEYGPRGARCLIIEVLPERLKLLSSVSPLLNQAIHISTPWLPLHIRRIYSEFRMKDSAALLSIDGMLLNILSRLSRDSSVAAPMPPWLILTREYLHDHFGVSVRLSEVAAAANVHPAHLAKSFQKHFRSTVGDYVRNLRLQHAAQELRSSEKRLADIALAAGFYDQSHFTKSFKLLFGVTPSTFRALTKSGKSNTKKL